MTLKNDRSYKATRPAGEDNWKGVAISHAGNGRRVEASGANPKAAVDAADAKLDDELGVASSGGTV